MMYITVTFSGVHQTFVLSALFALQNDITDVLDLTFSIDADEEKLILYERTQVLNSPNSFR